MRDLHVHVERNQPRQRRRRDGTQQLRAVGHPAPHPGRRKGNGGKSAGTHIRSAPLGQWQESNVSIAVLTNTRISTTAEIRSDRLWAKSPTRCFYEYSLVRTQLRPVTDPWSVGVLKCSFCRDSDPQSLHCSPWRRLLIKFAHTCRGWTSGDVRAAFGPGSRLSVCDFQPQPQAWCRLTHDFDHTLQPGLWGAQGNRGGPLTQSVWCAFTPDVESWAFSP